MNIDFIIIRFYIYLAFYTILWLAMGSNEMAVFSSPAHRIKTRPDRKKRMPYLQSVTSIYPETDLKMYANDKNLKFVPQCLSLIHI